MFRRLGRDKEAALAQYNPSLQTQYCREVKRCFFGEAPTLSTVAQGYGRNAAEVWVGVQINDLLEFAGCREKLRPGQISELAAMILEGYSHYRLTEVMLFFHRFKRCEYGKFYGAVDPMSILLALSVFDEHRAREHKRHEAAMARAETEEFAKRAAQLAHRYKQRVPDAATDRAPISFLQYRLMGYDTMSDEDLRREIDEIRAGGKTIPKTAETILAHLRDAFNIEE